MEGNQIVAIFVLILGVLLVGLLEDPSVYDVDLGPPEPYEGYMSSPEYIQDRLREDPDFRQQWEDAQEN